MTQMRSAYSHTKMVRLAAIALAALSALGLSFGEGLASLTVTSPAERILSGMENNTDRPGSDLHGTFFIIDRALHQPETCQKMCLERGPSCKAWTYVRRGVQDSRYAVCYFKHAVPPPVPNACCVSGVMPRRSLEQPDAVAPFQPGQDFQSQPPIAQPSATGCKPTFFHRQARPADEVCVTRESHDTVQSENATSAARWDPNGPYGPNTCIAGYVWREAFDGDVVCVSPERRAEVKEENRLAPTRREWAPGRPY